ncbi:MAG: cadherin repeat domain-containing protein, partial [Ekhidna sp.]|nr:cadherin repeat domain-containing protein [Ekhidna sp.]
MIGSDNRAEVPENTVEVLIVEADDADEDAKIIYRISGGDDRDKFSIDQKSGKLTFQSAPDYENPVSANSDNVYEVEVTANDGENSISQTLTITVTDVNALRIITSSASVTENTVEVLIVVAVDDDESAKITYRISGGDDRDKFSIDKKSGALTFKAAPD